MRCCSWVHPVWFCEVISKCFAFSDVFSRQSGYCQTWKTRQLIASDWTRNSNRFWLESYKVWWILTKHSSKKTFIKNELIRQFVIFGDELEFVGILVVHRVVSALVEGRRARRALHVADREAVARAPVVGRRNGHSSGESQCLARRIVYLVRSRMNASFLKNE